MHLDLVIPAYNEQGRIGPTIVSYLSELDQGDRILVALDRCTDRTADVVSEAAAGDKRVEIYNYPKLGKGGVITETFRHCEAEAVGFVDADGATPPSEILQLLQLVERQGLDGAIAGRHHSASVLPAGRPTLRRVTSAGFALGIRTLFDLPYGDTQCGAKVLRRSLIEQCLPLLWARDFLFDVDLLVIARRLGAQVAEVPTVWIDRDESHLDVLADSRRMAVSSLRLWLHHRSLPLATAGNAETADPETVVELQPYRRDPDAGSRRREAGRFMLNARRDTTSPARWRWRFLT